MNEQDKQKPLEEASGLSRSGAAKSSGWKRLLSKKWVSPAFFMAAAAIIVTIMWLYQGTDKSEVKPADDESAEVSDVTNTDEAVADERTLEVIADGETLQWPVVDRSELEIVLPHYDADAPSEERQQALLVSGTTFMPHMGIDLARPDNAAFDVAAAMSGKVTVAEQHPTNGYIVEIAHPDGLVTVYQSLSEINVKVGDEVKQGTLIAKAGRSELEKDLGVHLHFEVRENGTPVNPLALLDEEE
ncbi:metalloendopeptidase-like membrane protein [Thermobacillus composti KWC4]|jgi:stage II sporulation protein Q|uniref:Metalloendopeptidase-like membrane protein n=1 Tax=Thermobacillus composti (strain DSM 18247 / JCM 13945 / KWC4) TaxID=717605 RepID=L0EJE7_THECK|nr:M23 family metallopeptidase [Thermobacillus composti]AGA59851.1 metalloendopeptidase-like membrane protein [Thermobacillus composti KWC4]